MMSKKQPKTYVVTETQALQIFKGCFDCATDTSSESYQLWNAAKAAFPGLWEGLLPHRSV
jgi:hypothetical protein